ncbi:MAG: hypothetical protein Q8L14_29125 [Myxococcales bacterium]|nr:hypothetical protein [Myxococcales bacterium]
MPEVLFRVRAVMANRLWLGAWLAYSLLELALLSFPVARIPGYELSTGLSLITAILGGAFGVAFGRQESMRVASAPLRQASLATVSAAATLLFPAALTVIVAIVATLVGSPCSPFIAFGFVPLLIVPSALVVAALGVWLGLRFRKWWQFTLGWLAIVLLSALHTTWPIVFGPQVSAWNHLAGFLPGPLYDEELRVPAALLWFRAGSVLLAIFSVLGAARTVGDRAPVVRRAMVTAGLMLFGLELAGPTLGFRMSDEALAARLGGRTEGENIILMHPRGMTPIEVGRALGDLEFRFGQIADFVGGAPDGKVTVWWYRSAEQKQRLVGAAQTQFAKPWRREIHINELGFPHPVAKHELAHALLAPLGARPFGVTARLFGLSPHVGVIEGMAVAADNPVDELSLHEWTAAMKKQSMLPDVRTLLEPQGFYSAPASRAYTTAGSFLRWLGEARGSAKLRDLYRDGDFTRVYGVELGVLATEWEQFLDAVPLEPEAVNQAFARFRRGSLFDRPCAREVARLSSEVAQLSAEDGPAALAVLSRCEVLQPEEPAHVLSRASMLRRLGNDDEARGLLEKLAERVKDAPSSWADAALALVDLAIVRGDDDTARTLLTQLIEKRISPSMDRTARVRLRSLDSEGPVRVALTRYFSTDADVAQVHFLEVARAAQPSEPFVAYLLGRKLHQKEAFAPALEVLEVTRADPGVPASIRRETLRLMLEAAYGSGDCARVTQLADDAKAISGPFGAKARDWVERCRQSPPPGPSQ